MRGLPAPVSYTHLLIIDVHIIVSYGINLPAISGSIAKEVKYIVEKMTGFKVKKVNVYIDAMKTN